MQVQGLNIFLLGFVLSPSYLNAQAQGSNEEKLPDYIAPCYRDDPMFTECFRSSMLGFIRKLAHGIPELQVPPIEPLIEEEIDHIEVAGLRFKGRNASVWGISKLTIAWNSASAKTKFYEFEGTVETLEVFANYDVSGFFFVPIHTTGTVSATWRNIEYKAHMFFEVLPKNGVEYVAINGLKLQMYVNDGSLWISNLGPFEEAINQLLNNRINTRFLLNRIAPILDASVGHVLWKYSNRVFNTVPYNMFLPKGTGPVPATYDETLSKYSNYTFLDRIKITLD